MTTTNNTTKAQFNAERTAAGYKYLDSLRELMGVGQPVGEGGAPDRAFEKYARYVHEAIEMLPDGEHSADLIRAIAKGLQVRDGRATQPATAPTVFALVFSDGDEEFGAWDEGVFVSRTAAGTHVANHLQGDPRYRVVEMVLRGLPTCATPTDIAERARRTAQKIWTSIDRTWTVDELIEIIAAEFG